MKEAIRLLGEYTRGRFDIWLLAGPSNAAYRAQLMSLLRGARVPQSQSGVHALKETFFKSCAVEGDCEAVRLANFVSHCKEVSRTDSQ